MASPLEGGLWFPRIPGRVGERFRGNAKRNRNSLSEKKGSRTGAGEREATTTGRPETPDRTRPGREQKTGRAEPTRHRRTGHVHRVGQATNPPRPQTRKQAPAGTPN